MSKQVKAKKKRLTFGQFLANNSVPIMFILFCAVCIPISGFSPSYLLNEIVTRMGRSTFLILCLLLCPHLWQEAWEHLRHGRVTAPAAALLCGRHDYTSFCANRHMKKSAVRTVDAITVERLGDEVRLTFSGEGFLYHMVRILTGTLLEVGLGQRDADTMPAILAARDRAAAGATAPARGLILWETRYAHTHPEAGEEKRE